MASGAATAKADSAAAANRGQRRNTAGLGFIFFSIFGFSCRTTVC
jgi:hypothetical protein